MSSRASRSRKKSPRRSRKQYRARSISPKRKVNKDRSAGFVKQTRQQIRKNSSPVRSRATQSVSDGKQRLAFVRRRAIE